MTAIFNQRTLLGKEGIKQFAFFSKISDEVIVMNDWRNTRNFLTIKKTFENSPIVFLVWIKITFFKQCVSKIL